jgi:hypothetical protein
VLVGPAAELVIEVEVLKESCTLLRYRLSLGVEQGSGRIDVAF